MARKDTQTQDTQNTVVVSLVGGLALGFIVAMLFGAFQIGGKEDEGITNWMQGISGVLSMLVSLYAARLLYKTVRATQETLDITRSIGEAQTRAWVYDIDWAVNPGPDGPELDVSFQNFGTTPALNVLVKGKFCYYAGTSSDDDIITEPFGKDSAGLEVWGVLAPGRKNTFESLPIPFAMDDLLFRSTSIVAALEVSYRTVNSKIRQEYSLALEIKKEGEDHYSYS